MTRLTQLAISKRSVTLLLALGLFAGGIFSWGQLRQELVPDVEFPILTIVSAYPGAGSSDVTEQVTKPIERALTSVAGLESLNSTSANSLAFVVAQFEFGTDIKETKATVEANLDTLSLPSGVQPRVIVADINSQAVIVASVQGEGENTLEDAARIARTAIVPELVGVSGVSTVSVTGGAEERVKIALDPAKLADAGVSLQQIQGVLQANDLTIPTGTIKTDDGQVSVSALHQFGSVEELRQLIVGVRNPPTIPTTGFNPSPALPTPVRLGEIGSIETVEVQPTGYSRTNGVPSITLSVTKVSGGNTVQVADDVQARLAELQAQYAGRLTLTTLIDTSDFIKESRDGLVNEGGLGSVFAVLVIFLFLLNLRSTIVAAVSIPLSLFAALALMLPAGISINIMTLGGLAVAIGRVVDDAIVVLENIYRHRGRGDSMRDAVLNGTREVAAAITSSTLTTIAVFLPLGFVGGLISQFFLPFALTVTFALIASLIVSLTVVPVLAVFLLRTVKIRVGPDGELPETIWQRAYDPMLRFVLRRRATKWATIAAAAALFVVTSGLVASLPTQFINAGSEKISFITVIPSAGTSTTDVIARAEQVEAYLVNEAPNVELALTTIPSADDTSFQTLAAAQSGRPGNTARIFVRFDSSVDLAAEVDRTKADLAYLATDGFAITAEEQTGFGGSTLSAVITGSDPELLAAANDAVLEALSTIPELDNVTSDLIRSSPEIQVRVDPNKAIGLGLTTAQVAGDLRNIIVGGPAGRIVVDGQSIQVDMQLAVDGLGSVEALEAIPVGTVRQGPLGSIADVVQVDAQTRVTRVDGAAAATVSAAIRAADQGGVAAVVDQKIQALRDAGRLEGVDVNVGGVTAQQAEAFTGLFAAMAVAILLVYLVMVLVFNSLVDPLVIMFSLPLATIGAFPALAITGRPIGISALIGFLMLIGIVVTNAIVLLDLVEQLRHKGMPTYDALVQAGRTRVRPILMTAVATIMALFPLALGLNEGSIIAAELGTVVIGGLLSSTFLTLLVVPAVYSLVDGGKAAVRRRLGAGDEHPEVPDEFSDGMNHRATDRPAAAGG